MRKALSIERILCDIKDLAQSVASGNEKIVSAHFDRDEDLIIVTENKNGSYDWSIGFGEDNEEKTLTQEQVVQRIKDIIDRKCYGLDAEGDVAYRGEIYADYRDELGSHSIKKIFASDTPRDAFEDLMFECYDNCEWDYKSEVLDTIKEHFDDEDERIDYDEYEDVIRDWVYEHVYFNWPYDHYLNQNVEVDIIVDTGDGNYDFTRNELFGCNYSKKGLKESSSLVWLMKQQGYTHEQIVDFIDNENLQDSKFLESVYTECLNTSTCMNALTFFVKMTLEECLDMIDKLREQKDGVIVLSKDTPCGLYDPWSGAGSVLEIELERDVELPIKYIDSAMPDGCRGYGVDDIYGMCLSFWKGELKEIKGCVA